MQTFGSSITQVQFVLLALKQHVLEEVFGSIGRILVLEVIVEAKNVNISALGRKTGLNHTSVDRHVNTLKQLGLIEDNMWPGGIRMLKPAFQSLTIVLKKGFETKFRVTPP